MTQDIAAIRADMRKRKSHNRIPPIGVVWIGCTLAAAGMFGWNAVPSSKAAIPALGAAIHMPICMGSHRVNCIVDGDTIWYRGEKIRLLNFNAPEMHGNCPEESSLAWTARERLQRLLSNVPFSVERNGHDVYGRTLAVIRTSSGDVADIMVREKLAHYWHGYKEDWCAR